VVAPSVALPVAEYYGVDALDASSADSVWVLVWSEDGGQLTAAERSEIGLEAHRLVEREDFGRRLSAQLWQRAES
jgi:hypothetical protein